MDEVRDTCTLHYLCQEMGKYIEQFWVRSEDKKEGCNDRYNYCLSISSLVNDYLLGALEVNEMHSYVNFANIMFLPDLSMLNMTSSIVT